jgi:hypothetical protein
MFIAHFPIGYVGSKLLFSRYRRYGVKQKNFLWAGICGAIVPDLDMLYFYLVDDRQHHHHTYVTHFPILWVCLVFISSTWLAWGRSKAMAALAVIFSLNGLLHMVLDTVVGDIWWIAPFVDKPYAFFTVPAVYKPWWLNFILHWSFALELAFVLVAIYVWRQSSNTKVKRDAAMPRHLP